MAQCVSRARTVDREPDIAQSYVFADYAEAGRLYSADDLFSRTARRGGGAEVGGRRHPLRFSRTPAYAAFLKGDVGMLLAHPMLLHAADRARVPYAHATFPMKDGGAAPPVGLSDWLMAFKRNGHRKECAAFLDHLYSERATSQFAQGQGTLPVTASSSERLRAQRSERALREFIDQMPNAEFQPVGRTTWPKVRDALRRRIGAAVAPGGDPRALLKSLQLTAEEAEAARSGNDAG